MFYAIDLKIVLIGILRPVYFLCLENILLLRVGNQTWLVRYGKYVKYRDFRE